MVVYLVSTYNANSIDKVDIGITYIPNTSLLCVAVKMQSYPKGNQKIMHSFITIVENPSVNPWNEFTCFLQYAKSIEKHKADKIPSQIPKTDISPTAHYVMHTLCPVYAPKQTAPLPRAGASALCAPCTPCISCARCVRHCPCTANRQKLMVSAASAN